MKGRESMPNTARKHPRLIERLKQVREDLGLTLAEVKEKTDEQTSAPSPSYRTIQKVFAPGSEDVAFVYDTSLKAITIVLLRTEEVEEYDPRYSKAYFEQSEAHKLLLEQKNAEIDALRERLADVEELRQRIDYLEKENAQLRAAKDYVKKQLEDFKEIVNGLMKK